MKVRTQYSCLENPMDRGAWQATVQRLQSDVTEATLAQLVLWVPGIRQGRSSSLFGTNRG